MKKASKILLIIAGVFGILASLGMLLAGVLFTFTGFLNAIVYAVYGIIVVITAATNGTVTYSDGTVEPMDESMILILILMFVLIIAFMMVSFISMSIPAYVGFALLLTGSILAFVASKKAKKGVYIASIVFSSLSSFPALCYTLYALIYTLLILVVILTLLTPMGWLYLGLIVGFWGTLIAFVLSILGDIFGLIALAKQKKEEETQSLEVIENVQ